MFVAVVFIAVVFVAVVFDVVVLFVDDFADVAVAVSAFGVVSIVAAVAVALAPAEIVNDYQKSEIIVIAVGSNIDFKFLIH